MECRFRIGEGFDVHALADGLPLILGGVAIEHEKGCVAHSDGDVLSHAISDALLGASAMGDIGLHFPDTDPKYRGADSIGLLKEVVELLKNEGYQIGNIDCTIRAQRPKLRRYIDEIRGRLAEAMGLEIGDVSIKATTTEKLGFEGREEGIAVSAIALIMK